MKSILSPGRPTLKSIEQRLSGIEERLSGSRPGVLKALMTSIKIGVATAVIAYKLQRSGR